MVVTVVVIVPHSSIPYYPKVRRRKLRKRSGEAKGHSPARKALLGVLKLRPCTACGDPAV